LIWERKELNMPNKAKESTDIALVLGYIATKELPTAEKKVAVLTQLGYSNEDMAKICNTSPDAIRALKSKSRRGE
jgi:DNA-directed RNA polymerase specialized sigma24 family protein